MKETYTKYPDCYAYYKIGNLHVCDRLMKHLVSLKKRDSIPKICHKCKQLMKPIKEEDGSISRHTFHCDCEKDNYFLSIG